MFIKKKSRWRGESEVKVKSLSRVRLFVTPWTVAYQAPPSVGFSRQEHWSGLSFPPPEDLPDPGIEPGSPALQVDSLITSKSIIWTSLVAQMVKHLPAIRETQA